MEDCGKVWCLVLHPQATPTLSMLPIGLEQSRLAPLLIIYDPFLQKLGEHPVTVTCPTGGHQVIKELV